MWSAANSATRGCRTGRQRRSRGRTCRPRHRPRPATITPWRTTPPSAQTILFGGRAANGTPLGDTWVWNGAAWSSRRRWTIAAVRPCDGLRCGARRDRAFWRRECGRQKLNDVWEWNGAWQQKFPAVSPPARAYAALSSLDVATPGVAMFGGLGAAAQLNDTWIWNGTTWKQASHPGGRTDAAPACGHGLRQRVTQVGAVRRRAIRGASRRNCGPLPSRSPPRRRAPAPATSTATGSSDVTVYRPSNGAWYVLQSSTNFSDFFFKIFGQSGDIPVPADYDGDGTTDIAVYRPSNGAWYILQSSTNFTALRLQHLGRQPGDVPVPGDYDGDGKTDMAVYRPSNGAWYILQSSTNFTGFVYYIWGQPGDVPVPGDFDGDGKADVVVYRPSNGAWYILQSSTNFTGFVYYIWGGQAGDNPVHGRLRRRRQSRRGGVSPVERRLVHPEIQHELHRVRLLSSRARTATSPRRAISMVTARPMWWSIGPRTGLGTSCSRARISPGPSSTSGGRTATSPVLKRP